MKETLNRFKSVENKLASKPWFKKQGWLVSVHGFPRTKPEGVTFQVFKRHWFNEDNQGIHIESYLALDPRKLGRTYVAIHILHYDEVPGSKLKRIAITQPFVDAIYDEVKSWAGYEFRAGKYGQQPFTKILDGRSEDFESELETEIVRMCRKLGPVLDKVLKDSLR